MKVTITGAAKKDEAACQKAFRGKGIHSGAGLAGKP
jgi:hypothetical protein